MLDEVINTTNNVNTRHPVDGQETVSTNNKIEMVEVLHCNAGDARHRHGRVEEVLPVGKEMTHNLEVNFEKMTPFVKENTAKEVQNHAGKAQDTRAGAVDNAEVAETECVETMTTAELILKSELFNLRHRIQFMQVDFEHVDECKPHF